MENEVKRILISTVTPVYCGGRFLKDLVSELEKVKNKWEEEGYPFVLAESIFVDDDSIDNSSAVLAELEQKYSWVHVLSLSKNFGQHPATEAGILHSSGDWVITLDEDLQHPPEKFTLLLKTAMENDSDIVYASPKKSVHGSFYRDASSRLSKWFIGLITGNPFVKDFNSFRLVRGNIARGVAVICGCNLYLDLALCWFTKKISSITLDIEDKRYKENQHSGYSFRKLVGHWRRLFLSSQIRIFRLGALMGILAMLVAIFGGIFIIFQRVVQP